MQRKMRCSWAFVKYISGFHVFDRILVLFVNLSFIRIITSFVRIRIRRFD